jgi:hypothetical protein
MARTDSSAVETVAPLGPGEEGNVIDQQTAK